MTLAPKVYASPAFMLKRYSSLFHHCTEEQHHDNESD